MDHFNYASGNVPVMGVHRIYFVHYVVHPHWMYFGETWYNGEVCNSKVTEQLGDVRQCYHGYKAWLDKKINKIDVKAMSYICSQSSLDSIGFLQKW